MKKITPELKKKINQSSDYDFKVTQNEGVIIVKIHPGHPGNKAGLKERDII